MAKEQLEREIKIPADAVVHSGVTKIVFVEETYELVIGIGKDETATLLIGKGALEALKDEKNDINIY